MENTSNKLPREIIESVLSYLPLHILYDLRQSLINDIRLSTPSLRMAEIWVCRSHQIALLDHAIFSCLCMHRANLDDQFQQSPLPFSFLLAFSPYHDATCAPMSCPKPSLALANCLTIRLGHSLGDYNMPLMTPLYPNKLLQKHNAIVFKPHSNVLIPCSDYDLRHFAISFQGWKNKNHTDWMCEVPHTLMSDVSELLSRLTVAEVLHRQFRIDVRDFDEKIDPDKIQVVGFPDCILRYRLRYKNSTNSNDFTSHTRQYERGMPMEPTFLLEPIECLVTIDWIRRGGLDFITSEDMERYRPWAVYTCLDEEDTSKYDPKRGLDCLFPSHVNEIQRYLTKQKSDFSFEDVWEIPGLIDYVLGEETNLDQIIGPFLDPKSAVSSSYVPSNRLLVMACLRRRCLDPTLIWKFSFSRRYVENTVSGARRIENCSQRADKEDKLFVRLPGGWTVNDDVKTTVERIECSEFRHRLVVSGLRESKEGA